MIRFVWCIACICIFNGPSCMSAEELQLNEGWTITNMNSSNVQFRLNYKNSRNYQICVLILEGIHLSNQKLPSGVYSALEEANITESVLHSFNDVALRWIAYDTWTYALKFNGILQSNIVFFKLHIIPRVTNIVFFIVAETFAGSLKCNLVFYGLDTVANIQLNGHVLGPPFAQNMFVRYQYDVCSLLDFKVR